MIANLVHMYVAELGNLSHYGKLCPLLCRFVYMVHSLVSHASRFCPFLS